MGTEGGDTLRAKELGSDPGIFAWTALVGGVGKSLAVVSATHTRSVYSTPADSDSGALHARDMGITRPFCRGGKTVRE